VRRLEALLARLNPSAEICIAPSDELDLAGLLQAPPCPRAEFSGPVGHSDDIGSFTLFLDEPVHWTAFAHAMDVLIDLRGADLLRMKGLIAAHGHKGPLVVHAVQHILHPPVELLAWPDDDRRSRLVFIVRNIAREEVAALFRAVQDLGADRSGR